MFKSVYLVQSNFRRSPNVLHVSTGPKIASQSSHRLNFSDASVSENLYSVGRKQNESLDVYRKKLMYRSKLRGMKETILLLGTFATKYLKSFDEGKMKQFEEILEEPDPDVYNWVVVVTLLQSTAFSSSNLFVF
jgi:succinate dehydrogenase flavin-adding protein (antitoxin of CptAB toxin-antitoxin module)